MTFEPLHSWLPAPEAIPPGQVVARNPPAVQAEKTSIKRIQAMVLTGSRRELLDSIGIDRHRPARSPPDADDLPVSPRRAIRPRIQRTTISKPIDAWPATAGLFGADWPPVPLRRLAWRRTDGAADAPRRCLAHDPPTPLPRRLPVDAEHICCHHVSRDRAPRISSPPALARKRFQAMAKSRQPRTTQLYDRRRRECTRRGSADRTI